MIGRRAAVGLSLLCALIFSALVVQSAAAQKGTHSTNTTAVTCVKNAGKKDFKDPHCDEFVGTEKGEYGHQEIKPGQTTEIEVTNKETANKTTESTTSLLKGTVAGVTLEISCTIATTAGAAKASWIENVETEKKHTVKGTVNILFEKCTVLTPANCKVKEPIETVATFAGVEGLKPGGNEMGVEFSGENAKGNFAALTIEKGTCGAIGGVTFEVSGTATATSGTGKQAEKYSGATSVYVPNKPEKSVGWNPAEEMQTLIIGGKQADFTGTFTTKMGKLTKHDEETGFTGQNPISLTTAT